MTTQRTLAILAMLLIAALAAVPYIGVAIIADPVGGGYTWVPLIDVLPPIMITFREGILLVATKRIIWTAAVVACVYFGLIRGKTVFAIVTTVLALMGGVVACLSWGQLGLAVRPTGFIVLVACTLAIAGSLLLMILNRIGIGGEQSLAPVSGTRVTPAADAPGAPREPVR